MFTIASSVILFQALSGSRLAPKRKKEKKFVLAFLRSSGPNEVLKELTY